MQSGRGILAIWQDLEASQEEDTNEWYNREHHAERVDVPGFRRARRYIALSGSPKYFIYYVTDAPEVLSSGAYLARLNNPTPWTRRAMPSFRNNSRTVCRVVQHFGRGEGGTVLPIRLSPAADSRERLQTWLLREALPTTIRQVGVLAGALWEGDPQATRIPSEERKLRPGEDHVADWIVYVTATQERYLKAVLSGPLSPEELQSHGAKAVELTGIYQLLFALDRES